MIDRDDIDIDQPEVEEIEQQPRTLSKYDKVVEGGEDSKHKLTGLFRDWFLDYASYVILERAVPHVNDGLKPVQRRILHAMKRSDDGRYNKVASIIGDSMKYHPHGDSSIGGALVQLGQKDLLIDCQGNWGNTLTGDSAAAPRYIEARLTPFAKEVMFNNKTTEWITSYDGRNMEPVTLPAKFPLLLAQGAEGIAVGLSSKILPHNFIELVECSIAHLKGNDFELYPDFATGGAIDVSKYNDGMRGGAVKVRAKIVKTDRTTLTITEVPFGKTTSTIIESIVRANDKNKIKIRKVDDNTAENAEIVITIGNDVSADTTIDALYAFTDCEVSISPNSCVINNNKPLFLGVKEILRYSTDNTLNLLRRELEIKLAELREDWHTSSLEKIFIEKKIYKEIEDCESFESVVSTIDRALDIYRPLFLREITQEDIIKLTEIKIKKTAKYNTFKETERILAIEKEIEQTLYDIEHIVKYTIAYFKGILKRYGAGRERKTEIRSFDTIDASKVAVANAKLYVNRQTGFFGIGASMKSEEYVCECSDIDDIIIFTKDGKYKIVKVSEKDYFEKNIYYIGVFKRSDDRTIYNVLYRDGSKDSSIYMKRCAIKGVTRDKLYDITKGTPSSEIIYMSVNPNGEAEVLKIYFRPRPRLKKTIVDLDFSTILIKGRQSQGNVFSRYPIHKYIIKQKGVSTLQGKEVWYDSDIQKLNSEGRGELLGEFSGNDRTIIFTSANCFYTAGYDARIYFPENLSSITKFDSSRIYSAVYWDNTQKYYYLKRFKGEDSERLQQFIDDEDGSKLVAICSDDYPQLKIVFGGKFATRPDIVVDVDEFISVKGFKAKGKRLTTYDIASVEFIESLAKDEPAQLSDSEELEQPLIEDEESVISDSEEEIEAFVQGELF